MPSFDVVSEADMVEVRNAVDQANKEIGTRFDFRGSDARVEQKEYELTVYADSDFQLGQVKDVLTGKMAKRKVDVRFLDEGKIEKIGGDKVKQIITVKNGIPSDQAKKIVKLVKDNKLKVQASIQGTAVRVAGAKKDDLQATMRLAHLSSPEMILYMVNRVLELEESIERIAAVLQKLSADEPMPLEETPPEPAFEPALQSRATETAET